ncbi:MAG: methionine aminotransferase [Flavobacteriales bacterium]|nr:methionine aminotransferase [Flavobacteriales bacterium]
MHLTSKLPSISTSIFTTMSKLAGEHGAVNLGQGFPNFPIDPMLGKLVEKYIAQGFNQYAPMQGVPELRKALVEKVKKLYGRIYDWNDEITITAGGTQAIFTAITALVHENDEVVLFAPAYDCYSPAIELNGGIPVWIELYCPDYKINWELVRKRVNHRTRMIIINTPHNPCGTILTNDDLTELEKIISGTDIIVLSDEVYEHILFDKQRHESVARYPKLADQSFIVFSFGKTYHITGWKMGYILGPAALMNEFRKVHQFNVFSCNTPVQYALTEYMEDESRWTTLPKFYQQKRNFFLAQLKGSRFSWKPSAGSYFQLLNYENISAEKDVSVAMEWTRKHKVTGIPVSVFYPNGNADKVLRFCFAKDDETLEKAGEILCGI